MFQPESGARVMAASETQLATVLAMVTTASCLGTGPLGAWEMLEGATLNGSVWRPVNAQVDAARRGSATQSSSRRRCPPQTGCPTMRAAVDPPRPAFISITTSRRTSPWCVAESTVKDFAEGRDENPNVLVSVTCRETNTQDGVAPRDCGVADCTDHEAATSQLFLSCDSTRFRSHGDPDNRAAIMGGRGRMRSASARRRRAWATLA